MNRVVFLIDGFNLYHSIRDISSFLHIPCLKWLNINALCTSLLSTISLDARLEKVYYFSAYAHHLGDADVLKRHVDYIECLKSTGIEPILGNFKPKKVKCSKCNREFIKHEEKATDVGIAVKLLEVLSNKDCETVVLVTGDTDIIPAIETANRMFPYSETMVAFPFARKNDELVDVAPRSFKIHVNSYKNNQFPNPVVLQDGTTIAKPLVWV
ncbi:MAG: NYN domain-containing protein [Dehalococcoidia bacterium]